MEKLFLTSLFMFLLTLTQAQHVDVTEGTKSMREGSYNSYIISLDDVKPQDAEETWKDFMKEYDGKVKKDKKSDLWVSENVQIPSIGKNPVDVYAMFSGEKNGSNTTINVWFDTGSGYVNSIDMEDQADAATSIVTEFGEKVLKISAEENEKTEKKSLKDLEGDLKKLDSKEESLRKSISSAQSDILKWEKELSQCDDDISAKKKEIRKQEDVVENATDKAKKF